jgi:hypothetical protein
VTTFQPGSGRETLAPLGATALENRAAGAGRHPRTESVPALPASNVRLESAFHEVREEGVWDAAGPCRPSGQYREGHLPAGGSAEPPGTSERPRRPCSTASLSDRAINVEKSGREKIHRRKSAWSQASHHLSTAVETAVERKNLPAQTPFFALRPASFQALRALGGVAMIAASRSLAEGAITRRATPC